MGLVPDGTAGPVGSAHPVTPLLQVRGLRLDAPTPRGPAHILRGVDLDIGAGRIVGVVGESGSGKSSLALALLRLLPELSVRVSGHAVMDGTDLAALPEAAMGAWRGQRIAMIFQDPATALNPLLTVGTQLADVLRRRTPACPAPALRAGAEAALRQVEIADPARRLRAYPHELSGGMRQRVMIAMGLLARPGLLLADEPTTALDATVEAGIIALFRGLRAELGGSMLFISHDLGLVADLCDDIAVLYGGLVVEAGPAAAVTAAPGAPLHRGAAGLRSWMARGTARAACRPSPATCRTRWPSRRAASSPRAARWRRRGARGSRKCCGLWARSIRRRAGRLLPGCAHEPGVAYLRRHCEERSDAALQGRQAQACRLLDCHAASGSQ